MDISKLPKWAREKIEFLERENIRLRNELIELRAAVGVAPLGNAFVGVGYDHDTHQPKVYFPALEQVRFNFGEREYIDARRSGKNTIVIYGNSRTVIHPSASNSFEIEVE